MLRFLFFGMFMALSVTARADNLMEDLRSAVESLNTRSPIAYGENVNLTSASLDEKAVITFRYTMKSVKAKDVDKVSFENYLSGLFEGSLCSDKTMRAGFNRGASAHIIYTTIDGLDLDAGIINESSCSFIK